MPTIFLFIVFIFCYLPEIEAEALRDVKPPLELPEIPLFFYFLIFVLAILILRGIFYFKRRFQAVKVIQPLSAWEKALGKIEQLQRSSLIKQNRFKEFYSQLSEILRGYMEERFLIKAVEMTTQEFLISLRGAQDLTPMQKGKLEDFLTMSDLVKFAKQIPTLQDIEKHLELTRSIILETKLFQLAPNVK